MAGNAKKITISFPWLTLLTLLFVGLKLSGHIAWSWWWVFSPIWIPLGALVVVVLILLAIAVAVKAVD